MQTFKLESETRTLLDAVRAGTAAQPVDSTDAAGLELRFAKACSPILGRARVTRTAANHYIWALREFTKLVCKRDGWDLAFELEAYLRKWVGYGLDNAVLQDIVRTAFAVLAHWTVADAEAEADHETPVDAR
jgi:hypothetical protein